MFLGVGDGGGVGGLGRGQHMRQDKWSHSRSGELC
jgi:hypothetical protein